MVVAEICILNLYPFCGKTADFASGKYMYCIHISTLFFIKTFINFVSLDYQGIKSIQNYFVD